MRGIPAVYLIGGHAIADGDRQKWSSGDGGVYYIPYISYSIWIRLAKEVHIYGVPAECIGLSDGLTEKKKIKERIRPYLSTHESRCSVITCCT